jgi:CubicO group peptidase (beta-lactamase class C family)
MNSQFIHKLLNLVVILLLATSLMGLTGSPVASSAGSEEQVFARILYASHDKIETGDLETFTDELITRQLDEYHIAGAVVSIVQDGKIELTRGYGYANIEEQIPVTPDETIFRIGSAGKLFTWTAVMQLVEQGKIDLDTDINTYLPDFKIPDTFPEPITMLNLLSHTAGFEERTTGTESRGPEEIISLHEYLSRYMPDRVRPAGELITYSNYGTALAGYIVEAVSGMPFEKYIERYLFSPLSMAHSTFRQPLPSDLKNHLAPRIPNGNFVPGSSINFTFNLQQWCHR